MADRSVTLRLRAIITDYQKAMKTAAGETQSFTKTVSSSFDKLNKDARDLGQSMTRRVSVPLAAAGVGALKLAGDFETAFSQMVGLAGVAGDEVEGLREQILQLSGATGVGPIKLAEALYEASSAGLETADALAAVEVAAKASAAGMGESSEIVGLIASAMKAYGSEAVDAAKATDILAAAVQAGRANPRELAGSLGVVLPIAAELGVTFDEVGASVAYLSTIFGDTSRTTNSLRVMFANMLSPSEEGRKALEKYTGSATSLKDAIDRNGLLGAFELLRSSGIVQNDQAMRALFSDIDGYTAATSLLTDASGDLNGVFAQLKNSVGALDKAWSAQAGSKQQQIKEAYAQLQVALIRIGAIMAPLAADVAGAVERIARAFGELPQWAQGAVVGFLALAAAAGPIVRSVSSIATIFKTLHSVGGKALDALATGAYDAAGNLGTLAIAAAGAALLIVGLTLAIQDHNDKIEQAKVRQNALADALRETGSVAGGVGRLLSEAVANNQFFSTAFAAAGVSIEQVAAALEQGGPAWQQMTDRILAAGKAAGLGEFELKALRTVLGQLPDDAEKARAHLDNMTKSGVKPAGQAGADAAGGIDTFTGSLIDLDAQAEATAKEIQALLSVIDSAYAAAFDVADAQSDYADALADVDSATRSTGGSTRDMTNDQKNLERATRDVTDAQESLAEAEKNLAEARKGPSAREKSDAGLDVREAQLGLKQAQRAVTEARKRMAEERKKGKEGDVAGANLDLESAQLSLARATNRVKDAQAEQNKVLKSGEDASEEVTDALERVEEAQERVTDATDRQMEAERTLRGEASGGPVADRAKNIASAYDRLVTSSKNVIDKMVEQQKPAGEVIKVLDEQQAAAQRLIDTYGDPEGKLQRFIDNNDKLKTIFADAKFQEDAAKIARAVGVIVTKSGVIIDMGGGDTSGLATGGLARPFETYEMGEKGPEALTLGATRPPKSFDLAPPDKLGKGRSAELSGRSATGAQTFMVGLNGPQFITMGAQGGWVTPNHQLADIDGARAKGGPVDAGKTYLVGENGPEIITVGGMMTSRHVASSATSVANRSASSTERNYTVNNGSVAKFERVNSADNSNDSSSTSERFSSTTRESDRESLTPVMDQRRAEQFAGVTAAQQPWTQPMMPAANSSTTSVTGGDLIVQVHGSVWGTDLENIVYKSLQQWTRHNGSLRLPIAPPH